MATTRQAHAIWEGTLSQGSGTLTFDSSRIGDFPVSCPSRTEQAGGVTSPEELIASAHASCFSMALSHGLTEAGTPPTRLTTQADVAFEVGIGIVGIRLAVHGEVPGIEEIDFLKTVEDAKTNCPVSQALTGTDITVTATLARACR
ncbi:OsmC family peroxiredoxin [Streptomyces formicae]